MNNWSVSSVLLIAFAVGCGSDAKPPPNTPAKAAPKGKAPSSPVADAGGATVVSVSEDIRRLCGIDTSQAYFRYDSSDVDAAAGSVLDQLATCFETGPLGGRALHLVGHADPRGEDEYNYVLGERRAQSVESALRARGMKRSKVSTTSRGEIEATGDDEAGWARDRRVDVLLGS